ncbi:unnamed protein product [Protopolystoma xenopodis]|uniref:Uncharacterized protein n=1 Tax=Protopolystoma xenopodis TaxID=117903 RepID=A0A3S5CR96_9PLAT|nr:unnamed protein product [Protopolystoma xenopodis]
MLHPSHLTNPHLRARLAEVVESLVPQRDDDAEQETGWNRQAASGLLSGVARTLDMFVC